MSEWTDVTLGAVASHVLGKTKNNARQTGNGVIPYLRNANVQWGGVNLTDVQSMDFSLAEKEKYSVVDGDLFICEGGAGVGRSALYRGPSKVYAFQNALHRVRAKRELTSNEYLRYVLEVLYVDGTIAAQTSGSTIPHLSSSKVRDLPLRLPSLEEQDRIIHILQSADTYVSSLKSLLSAYQLAKDRLLGDLFSTTGSLPTAAMPWGRLVTRRKQVLSEDGPMLSIGVRASGVRLADRQGVASKTKAHRIEVGELVYLRQGAASGVIGVSTLSGRLSVNFPVLTISDGWAHDYVHYLVQSPYVLEALTRASSGTAQSFLSEKSFLEVEVATHTTAEDRSVVVEVLKKTDEAIAAAAQQLSEAEKLRQHLLQDLLSLKVQD